MQWLRNISVISSFLLVLISCPLLADDISDSKSAAASSANMAFGQFGSASGVQNNISTPMTSAAAPMHTIDGSTSFNAQMSCPSSSSFLQIFVQPMGSGDLGSVMISQDTTMSGHFTYSYQLPLVVSGVCANGIISCNPGTWNWCNYYQWIAAPNSNQVSLQQVDATVLGGCTCINNSCGSNLVWTNLSYILNYLGGGVVGAIQVNNPHLAISSININGPIISFAGQGVGNCNNTGGSSASATPEQYYTNWSAMSGDTQTMVTTQSSNPTSYYSLLANSSAAMSSPSNYVTCNITRDETVSQQEKTCISNPPVASNNYCGGIPFVDCTASNPGQACGDEYNQIMPFVSAGYGDLYVNGSLAGSGVLNGGSWTGCGCDSVSINGTSYGRGTSLMACVGFTCPLVTPNSGCAGSPISGATPTCFGDGLSQGINDGCVGAEDDSSCTLQTETVDGILTFNDFNPTGLLPLPSCRNFTGTFTHSICAGWWQKQRTYLCTAAPYDFSGIQRRMQNVTSTTVYNTTSFYYQDLTPNADGVWSTTDVTTALPPPDPTTNCEQACKTQLAVTDTQAGVSGNVSQQQVSVLSSCYLYHPCTNGTCPAGPGESIITNCQCIDEFAEAAAIMQTLRMAGQDMVCSSGTPQQLQ